MVFLHMSRASGHPAEQWPRHNQPFFGETTLQDVLGQRVFTVVLLSLQFRVERMMSTQVVPSTKFENVYGKEHEFDIARYKKQHELPGFPGKTYEASRAFQNDNEQVAVVTQSIVQDFMWLHMAKLAILQKRWPAYFVPVEQDSDAR